MVESGIDRQNYREATARIYSKRRKHNKNGEELYLINEAVKGVSIRMQIIEAAGMVWILRGDYCSALRNAGFRDLHIDKPHIPIEHFLKRLKPYAVHRRMGDIITWRKNKDFHREDSDSFIREAAIQAEKLHVEEKFSSSPASQDN